jgi:hypothetical protein
MGLWEFLGQLDLNVFLFLDRYWSVACCNCILIRQCILMFSSILADLKTMSIQPTTYTVAYLFFQMSLVDFI